MITLKYDGYGLVLDYPRGDENQAIFEVENELGLVLSKRGEELCEKLAAYLNQQTEQFFSWEEELFTEFFP